MEKGLTGKKVVICGSRKTEEIMALIEKQGGIPIVRTIQGMVFLAEQQVQPDLEKFIGEGADWVLFTTGIGIDALVQLADKLGCLESFLQQIRHSKVGSRGYKTLAALRKLNIEPDALDEDGTTKGLIRALKDVDFTGKKVMVQLHGEDAPSLMSFLRVRGASIQTILPYQHIQPEEDTVQKLVGEIESKMCDAVCFTTATQVRSLFEYAKRNGKTKDLIHAFQENVLAVAVGKVTAEALREEGIERFLVPEHERMGAMIVQLSHYFQDK